MRTDIPIREAAGLAHDRQEPAPVGVGDHDLGACAAVAQAAGDVGLADAVVGHAPQIGDRFEAPGVRQMAPDAQGLRRMRPVDPGDPGQPVAVEVARAGASRRKRVPMKGGGAVCEAAVLQAPDGEAGATSFLRLGHDHPGRA
ncbi:MAG: hypothetical protein ACLFQF_07745 [Rhodosalinus sp.]